jgi:hypothetical protein
LVHRDVKPSNVLIDTAAAREHAYLTDFGIAKGAADATALTGTGAFIGTLDYSAPEVFRGEKPDARADVYSLGCALFECLTGEKPFVRDTQLGLIYAHLEDPPPSVRERRPDVSPDLDAVVARALSKDAAERFPSAGALADAAVAAVPAATTGTAPRARPVRRRGGRRGLVAAGALLAVALGAAGVAALSGGGGGGEGGAGTAAAPASASAPAPTPGGRWVVGSRLDKAPGKAGYCSGNSPVSACTMVQITLGKTDQAIPADGVVTSWSVRGAKGALALRVIEGPPGRRRVVAEGPFVHVGGSGVKTFEERISVRRGQRIGVELAKDGFLPVRFDNASQAESYEPPLGGTAHIPEKDAGGTVGYEVLYNATIEPDDDHDGKGDLTQDDP